MKLYSLCLVSLSLSCLTPPGLKSPAAGPSASSLPASLGDFSRTSPELLAKLRPGWNLGNSLDVPDGETRWGNPKATKELFAAVAQAGFKLVRVPVTWTPHIGPGPNYVIDASWLERVAEVVSYARAAGLYTIVNLHHDGADGWKEVGWLSLKDDRAKVRAQFVAVWTQIAKYFANHGEELIFESMNEIHDGYGQPDPRYYVIINELNQTFVDLVRASGGNNGKRHLLIPGYNTNINQTIEGFKLPTDSAKSRLILSVHYYDPYLFTLEAKKQAWGKAAPEKDRDDWGQEEFVVTQFDKLKARYVDKGVPVILGEYGAVYQDGYEDYQRYYVEYVTKAAVDRGIVPVYWDNGGRNSGNDSFAVIDREANGVFRPKLMEAILRAATSPYSLANVVVPAAPEVIVR